jgi:arylsulfatase A-like enzyme
LLDEREKRQQAKHEADSLRRKVAELEAQMRPQPKTVDLIEDPEGFARQQQQMLQTAILQDRYERSLDAAREKHGEDKVQEVIAFFNDPKHAPKSSEFVRQPDPFRAAFRYYEEQREVEQVRTAGGLTAMQDRIRAEIREQILAEMSGAPKPATPPPSLSGAASPGPAKTPPINGFDAAFGA